MGLQKILVVEDEPRHLQDAKEFFGGIEKLEIHYATNLSDAQDFLGEFPIFTRYRFNFDEDKVDGVISDLHFPLCPDEAAESPLAGLMLGNKCHYEQIPFVFCTEWFRHSEKYYFPINFINYASWKTHIIDTTHTDMPDEYFERIARNKYALTGEEKKPWGAAYKYLQKLAAGGKGMFG